MKFIPHSRSLSIFIVLTVFGLIAFIATPAHLTCMGDCVLVRTMHCIETNDADCIVAEATSRFIKSDPPKEHESFDESDIADAVVRSGKAEQFIIFAKAAVGSDPSALVQQKMSGLLQKIVHTHHDTGQKSSIVPFIGKTKQVLGITLQDIPSSQLVGSNNRDAYADSLFVHRRSPATDITEVTHHTWDRPFFRFSRQIDVYPSLNLDEAVLSESACASAGSPELVGLRLTSAGSREAEALLEKLNGHSGVPLESMLAPSDATVQIVLLATLPRHHLSRHPDMPSILDRIQKVLSLRIAGWAKTLHDNEARPFGVSELVHRPDDPLRRELNFHAILYVNWIALALDIGAADQAIAAAATLYELLIQSDRNAQRRHNAYFDISDTPYAKNDLFLSLSHVLASRGYYGVPLAYANSLEFDKVRLKAGIVSCTFYALMQIGRYAEAIELLRGIPPTGPDGDATRCTHNLVFGRACEALLAFRGLGDDDASYDMLAERYSSRNSRLRNDSEMYFEVLKDRLCARLASDDRLVERWPQVLEHLSSTIQPDTAVLADLHKRQRLHEYRDPPSEDQSNALSIGKMAKSKALHFARARLDVRLLVEQGNYRRALEVALKAGISKEFESPARDEHLVQRIVASIVQAGDVDWLLTTIRTGVSEKGEGLAPLDAKALMFVVQCLIALDRLADAATLQGNVSLRDGALERSLAIASELVKRRKTAELVSLVSQAKSHGYSPVRLAIRLVPEFYQAPRQ